MNPEVKISASVNLSKRGYESEPESVTVIGAGFLATSAVVDIAQKALDIYLDKPSGEHRFIAMRPDGVSNETTIRVIKR